MTTLSTATLALGSGTKIPQVGLGVWQAPRGALDAAAMARLDGLEAGLATGRDPATQP